MYGVAVALQAAEEAEGEDADGEAHQRHHNAHPRDHGQQHLVHPVVNLESGGEVGSEGGKGGKLRESRGKLMRRHTAGVNAESHMIPDVATARSW